jgi:hypothetical protein
MGHEKVLRLLDERVASCRMELDRLGLEAARLAKLIEDRGLELDRLTIAREVIGALPDTDRALDSATSESGGGTETGVDAETVLTDPFLGLVGDLGGKVCCRDIVTALGQNPRVARNAERVRRHLKLLVDQGHLLESRPGIFTLTGGNALPNG